MKELKPCPFCGGKARIARNVIYNSYAVHCTKCMASVIGHIGMGEEEIINEWNRRYEDE